MHKCGFQPALPSQLGKKRLHGMCGQFLSRLSELTRKLQPRSRQGGTTRFACNRNVKIIDNTYRKQVNSAKRVNSLSRDNSPI